MTIVLPSVTTLSPQLWRSKAREVETLKLREVALFVTGLSVEERSACFTLLESIHVRHHFRIPFVHAVSSMTDAEYRYLIDTFGTEAFNLHPMHEFPLEHWLSREVRSKIYIENSSISSPIPDQDLEAFAGICFDLSHLEDSRRSNPKSFERLMVLARRFPVGANHISAVRAESYRTVKGYGLFSDHEMRHLDELNYLSAHDPCTFGPIAAIELENSLSEQLEAHKRISAMLDEARRTHSDRCAA